MIRIFHLLDAFGEDEPTNAGQASAQVPLTEVTHPKARPAQKYGENRVLFPVHNPKNRQYVPPSTRVRNRVAYRDRRFPPLFDYFRALNSNRFIRYATMVAIVLDCICLGINTVIHGSIRRSSKPEEEKTALLAANRFLNIISTTCLLWFTTYIVLRIVLAGRSFYRDIWLLFDIVVTLISIFAETISYLMMALSESNGAMYIFSKLFGINAIGTLRILLSLKILTQIESTRAIMRAVGRSLAQLIFVVFLFLTIGYVFAMVGVIYIDETKIPDYYFYKGAFSSVSQAYITLFQLTTNDHWTGIVNEYQDTVGGRLPALAMIYGWLLISNGILRQLFTSILVGAYQSIRKEEEDERKEEERREQVKQQLLNEKLEATESFKTFRSPDTGSGTYVSSTPMLKIGSNESTISGHNVTSDHSMFDHQPESGSRNHFQYFDVTDTIKRNLERQLVYLTSQGLENAWPRDTLMRYFMIMEAHLENLRERFRIQKMLRVAILSMNET